MGLIPRTVLEPVFVICEKIPKKIVKIPHKNHGEEMTKNPVDILQGGDKLPQKHSQGQIGPFVMFCG